MWRRRFLRSPSLRAVHRAGTGAATNLSSRQSQFEQPAWSSDGWDRQQEMRVSCEASLADEFGSEIDAATAMRVLTAAAATTTTTTTTTTTMMTTNTNTMSTTDPPAAAADTLF